MFYGGDYIRENFAAWISDETVECYMKYYDSRAINDVDGGLLLVMLHGKMKYRAIISDENMI